MPHAGELSALATAQCWALTALFFAAAGRRIGSLPVNLIRLAMGIVLLSIAAVALRGQALPLDAPVSAWWWLSLSGLAGFVLGDLCLFRAFVVLGPRLSTLVMSLSPPLTALMAWAGLGGSERLDVRQWAGMMLTLIGIGLAVFERRSAVEGERHPARGVLLALGGAVGQSLGLVLSKRGMGSYGTLPCTQIRVIAGLLGFALVFTLIGGWDKVRRAFLDARALLQTALGAFFGPFLGVTLSLAAVRYTKAGVAASIMATTPILVIPFVVLLRHERVGARGLVGTILAVLGVALLSLSKG